MTKPRRRGFSAALFFVSATFPFAGCGGPSADDAKVIVAEPPAAETPAAPAAVAEAPPDETAPAEAEPSKAEGWGTITGRVVFDGSPPEPAVLVAKGDDSVQGGAVCSARAILSEKLVVNPENQGIRHAIVYIPKPTAVNPEALAEARAANVVFDQKGCKFTPHVLAAVKGTKVAVNSSDPVTHNINIKLSRNKANLTVAPGVTLPPVELKNAEVKPGEVVCDIHTWMKAYWLVLDSPYFAVTDKDGKFTIKNAPAGSQKVVVWQESAPGGYLTPASGQPVDIAPGGETTKDFTLKASDAAK